MILEILTTRCWFQAQRVIFQNLSIDRQEEIIVNVDNEWPESLVPERCSEQKTWPRVIQRSDCPGWAFAHMEDPDPSVTSVSLVPPALLVLASLGGPGLNDHLKSVSLLCLCLVQFSSVTQSCPTLCNPMDCSTPGLPVYHQLRVGNK